MLCLDIGDLWAFHGEQDGSSPCVGGYKRRNMQMKSEEQCTGCLQYYNNNHNYNYNNNIYNLQLQVQQHQLQLPRQLLQFSHLNCNDDPARHL